MWQAFKWNAYLVSQQHAISNAEGVQGGEVGQEAQVLVPQPIVPLQIQSRQFLHDHWQDQPYYFVAAVTYRTIHVILQASC